MRGEGGGLGLIVLSGLALGRALLVEHVPLVCWISPRFVPTFCSCRTASDYSTSAMVCVGHRNVEIWKQQERFFFSSVSSKNYAGCSS